MERPLINQRKIGTHWNTTHSNTAKKLWCIHSTGFAANSRTLAGSHSVGNGGWYLQAAVDGE